MSLEKTAAQINYELEYLGGEPFNIQFMSSIEKNFRIIEEGFRRVQASMLSKRKEVSDKISVHLRNLECKEANQNRNKKSPQKQKKAKGKIKKIDPDIEYLNDLTSTLAKKNKKSNKRIQNWLQSVKEELQKADNGVKIFG